MSYRDPIKQKEALRKHYIKYKEKYKKRSKDRYWRRKTWLKKLFEKLQCINCGENNRVCLDLHHIDPKIKEGNISHFYRNAVHYEKMIAEIEKCIPLCSNCHRKFHANFIILPNNVENFKIKISDELRKELSLIK